MPVKIEANVTLYLLPTCENDIAEYVQKKLQQWFRLNKCTMSF